MVSSGASEGKPLTPVVLLSWQSGAKAQSVLVTTNIGTFLSQQLADIHCLSWNGYFSAINQIMMATEKILEW